MWRRGWLVIAVAACGDDGGGGGGTADARVADARPADAAIDAPRFSCMTSPSHGTHKIYLNFEGVTLTGGMTDATQNRTSLLPNNMSPTFAAWKSAAGDRVAQIDSIVCSVREAYFAFDVEIVTTRPASGGYDMVVFGGQPSDIGQTSTSIAMEWIAAGDCLNAAANDVAIVFERPQNNNAGTTTAAHSAIGAAAVLGASEALSLSKNPTNCMCHLNGDEFVTCDRTKMCEFSATSTINTGSCTTTGGTEDQIAKLTAIYGARQP